MIEQIPNVWWVLVLLGLAGGIVAGSLGVGGGIIFVPVLVIVFLLPQKTAQGTALLACPNPVRHDICAR